MTPTLDEIKADHAALASKIAALEAAARELLTTVSFNVRFTLAPGERYAGFLVGADGMPTHHVILLPGELDEGTWEQANDWAATTGGELPTRREQSLLFANLRDEFQSSWYWSSEAGSSSSSAWYQYFHDGGQDDGTGVTCELRARAVRRLAFSN